MTRARLLLCVALTAGLLAGRAPASPLATAGPLTDATFDNNDRGQISSTDQQLQKALTRPHSAPASNPLWAIPLSALPETRERPLFSPSRRPPPAVADVRHRPPERRPPRPLPPEIPPLKLVGTIIGGAKGFGLFIDTSSQATVRLTTGGSYHGWILRTVRERTVVMEKNHLNQTLSLPAPSRPATNAPPPARPGRGPATSHPRGPDPVGKAVYD